MTSSIPRLIRGRLLEAAQQQLVVGITGPRQAGKTTLVRSCFPDHVYLNLEDPELLAFAQRDPKGFLAREGGMIIDEVQRVPALLSYTPGVSRKFIPPSASPA